MSLLSQLQSRADRRVMNTYGPARAAFVRGQGSRLFDDQGESWLDFLCGLGVTNLGHAHPAVSEAVTNQVNRLVHTSNLYLTEPAILLAERLAGITGLEDARVFFAQCGATANEAAIKLARRHGKEQDPDKVRLVTLEGSFHGRTMATLEATGQVAKHAAFEPLAGFVDHVAYDDAEAMSRAVGPSTCAVMLEIVQGEGGVRPVPLDVLAAARKACDAHGALLIIDEVQTGIGRTGSWFAFQQTDIVPDVVTVAKALANGLPIGACIAGGVASRVLGPGDHATTFGGNPVTSAAALAVLETIAKDSLLEAAQARSRRLWEGLSQLSNRFNEVDGVRGRGLLMGLELDSPIASALEAACRERYLLVNAVSERILRLAPPLTVSRQEIDQALSILTEALSDVSAARTQETP